MDGKQELPESATVARRRSAGVDHYGVPLRDPQRCRSEQTDNWHLLSADRLFETLASSIEGLKSDEALSRLYQYGPNQLRERKRAECLAAAVPSVS